MPITAGGTVFMYNLKINGQQVTNLRLSGDNVTKIFTGAITNWDDPALGRRQPGSAAAQPDDRAGGPVRRLGDQLRADRVDDQPVPRPVERLLREDRSRAGAAGRPRTTRR